MPKAINVFVPAKIANNLEAMFKLQRDLMARLGHPGCYSGRDIFYQNIVEDIFVAHENGALDHFGGPAAGR